jgi:hypothetical protein
MTNTKSLFIPAMASRGVQLNDIAVNFMKVRELLGESLTSRICEDCRKEVSQTLLIFFSVKRDII